MDLFSVIQKRHTTRTFDGQPLDDNTAADLNQYLNGIRQPFDGCHARVRLCRAADSPGSALRTFGCAGGARDFMALMYRPGRFAAINAGYMMEQAVLWCTARGIDTFWIGGTFGKSGAAALASPEPDEILAAVCPVGHSAGMGLRDKIMRGLVHSDSRMDFDDMFFLNDFFTTLPASSPYRRPLEMVRLAPSSRNSQPWRAIVSNGCVDFYSRQLTRFSDIDMGIALCHFELSCRHLGINGTLSLTFSPSTGKTLQHVATWRETL